MDQEIVGEGGGGGGGTNGMCCYGMVWMVWALVVLSCTVDKNVPAINRRRRKAINDLLMPYYSILLTPKAQFLRIFDHI